MSMRPLRDNALSIAFGAIFVLALAGQSVAGWLENNERLQQHGMPAEGFGAFAEPADELADRCGEVAVVLHRRRRGDALRARARALGQHHVVGAVVQG